MAAFWSKNNSVINTYVQKLSIKINYHMSSRAIAVSTLVLRIFTFLACVACVVIFILDTFRDTVLGDGDKVTFADFDTYRFVLSTAVIGAAYTLLQLPFDMYYACSKKRMIQGDFLLEFDYYGGKTIAFLLASGVGAGFAASVELKKFFDAFFAGLAAAGAQDAEEGKALYDHFLNKGNVATGLLLLGFVFMAILSVLSSINRTTKSTSKGFFFT